jgi:hypothetical protein
MESTNRPRLNDPLIFPDHKELEINLKQSFEAYTKLMNFLTNEPNRFLPEWRFYKDGNAWLCKVTNKKKTVCWVSVWDGYFKAGFYFTEKNKTGIDKLPIRESIKADFYQNKPIGKLLPLSFTIKRSDELADLKTVIQYKNSLK